VRTQSISHIFVEFIPGELQNDVLYISIEYATMSHLCMCGCGNKVVTPLSPAQWKLTFDGKTVSLSPSIGSWNLACRSHYWITENSVMWARKWTDEQIALGRERDRNDVIGSLDNVNQKNNVAASGKTKSKGLRKLAHRISQLRRNENDR
jgi:hypothetical protein